MKKKYWEKKTLTRENIEKEINWERKTLRRNNIEKERHWKEKKKILKGRNIDKINIRKIHI